MKKQNKINSANKKLSDKYGRNFETDVQAYFLPSSHSETLQKCFNIILQYAYPTTCTYNIGPKSNGLLATYMVNENVVCHSYDHYRVYAYVNT
jgi:hypothetical protein